MPSLSGGEFRELLQLVARCSTEQLQAFEAVIAPITMTTKNQDSAQQPAERRLNTMSGHPHDTTSGDKTGSPITTISVGSDTTTAANSATRTISKKHHSTSSTSELETLVQDFLYATQMGNLHDVKQCIDSGVDIDARDGEGLSALHYASEDGHLEIVQYLLETCHVDKEATDNDGWTALHCASKNGHLEIVQYLLDTCHVDAKAKDVYGKTALHYATKNDHVNIVQFFIGNVSRQ